MTETNDPLEESGQQLVREATRTGVGWLLGLGVAMVLLGILAILAPIVASGVVAVSLGVLLLIGGAAQLLHAFHARDVDGWEWNLLVGALYAVVGVLLLFNIPGGVKALTLIVGISFLLAGFLKAMAAWQLRAHPNWAWGLLSGVCSLVLGVLILTLWPGDSLWILGLLVGINLLFRGWAMVTVALTARSLMNAPPAE